MLIRISNPGVVFVLTLEEIPSYAVLLCASGRQRRPLRRGETATRGGRAASNVIDRQGDDGRQGTEASK